MCYYCGNHRRTHDTPKPFRHHLNALGASHHSVWETRRHKQNIYLQAAFSKENLFNKIREISLYPYPLEYNVSVMFSRQHTYFTLHQQTYNHSTHWTTKHQLIVCRAEPSKRRPRVTVVPFDISMNIDITWSQT